MFQLQIPKVQHSEIILFMYLINVYFGFTLENENKEKNSKDICSGIFKLVLNSSKKLFKFSQVSDQNL